MGCLPTTRSDSIPRRKPYALCLRRYFAQGVVNPLHSPVTQGTHTRKLAPSWFIPSHQDPFVLRVPVPPLIIDPPILLLVSNPSCQLPLSPAWCRRRINSNTTTKAPAKKTLSFTPNTFLVRFTQINSPWSSASHAITQPSQKGRKARRTVAPVVSPQQRRDRRRGFF